MRQIKINSTDGSEIVLVATAKDYMRVSSTVDDNIITRMITQARIWCENYISRDIVAKTRTYYLPETNGIFDLPFGPVSSITSVKSDDVAIAYTVLGLDNESIELDGGYADKVKIVYVTSGLSDSLLQQAIMQLTSTYYDNRSDFTTDAKGDIDVVPTNIKSILNSYKAMYL
tara:strand:- start:43 stop:558 length:516 start_codon:yes stop_codon:yes gene_type:complete